MISDRLKQASYYLKGFNFLADCGTDHALLPIYAIEKKYIKKAIASDNKNYPLMSAQKNISEHRLFGQIKTVLADGLSYLNLENKVDVVTILGMGGILIVNILSQAYLYNVKRMILQANSQNKELRLFLEKNKWKIIDEVFMKENGTCYQIIICEPGAMVLSDAEREFGPMILKNKPEIFIERIQAMIDQLLEASHKTKNNDTKFKLADRVQFLREVLK